jgi:hypothetical protein
MACSAKAYLDGMPSGRIEPELGIERRHTVYPAPGNGQMAGNPVYCFGSDVSFGLLDMLKNGNQVAFILGSIFANDGNNGTSHV